MRGILILAMATLTLASCSSTRKPASLRPTSCLIMGAQKDLVNWGPDFPVNGEERIHFYKNVCPLETQPEGKVGSYCSCPAKNWRTGETAVLKGIIMD